MRYDTRSYFNVRSKADVSQLNLPHGNKKSGERKAKKSTGKQPGESVESVIETTCCLDVR